MWRIVTPRWIIASATMICSLVSFTPVSPRRWSGPETAHYKRFVNPRCAKLGVPREARWRVLLHLVEEDLSRHAAEEAERRLQAQEEGAHVLARIEAHPEQARVAEDDQQPVAHAPGQSDLGEVDLGLLGRRGLEAHDGLGQRARPNLPHVVFEPCVAARISGRPYLLEEANGRELRVGSQTGEDHRLVGIELVRRRRA